jgi:ABC-type branched-subunit amino acid transport system ATPase component
MSDVLRVAGLEKSFGAFRAVADVSFSVAAGEIVALIGPNGAGKTTTFNMINGQLMPDSGRVVFESRDVTGLAPRALWAEGVARTFQITQTFTSMTVAENVAVALMSADHAILSAHTAADYRPEDVRRLLAEVGMEAFAHRQCSILSYGDVKRVEFAMALASAPRLLLMDEPTAGMAPRERAALMRLVSRVARERNTAVLFTEHDMDIVFSTAARVLVMHAGAIIAEGTPEQVRANPLVRDVYLGHGEASSRAELGTVVEQGGSGHGPP